MVEWWNGSNLGIKYKYSWFGSILWWYTSVNLSPHGSRILPHIPYDSHDFFFFFYTSSLDRIHKQNAMPCQQVWSFQTFDLAVRWPCLHQFPNITSSSAGYNENSISILQTKHSTTRPWEIMLMDGQTIQKYNGSKTLRHNKTFFRKGSQAIPWRHSFLLILTVVLK